MDVPIATAADTKQKDVIDREKYIKFMYDRELLRLLNSRASY